MCFAVCYPLQGWLSFAHQIEAELIELQFPHVNHAVLRLPDGRILDPTADQFNGELVKFPKVYLGPMPEIYQMWIEQEQAETGVEEPTS